MNEKLPRVVIVGGGLTAWQQPKLSAGLQSK